MSICSIPHNHQGITNFWGGHGLILEYTELDILKLTRNRYDRLSARSHQRHQIGR